MTSERSSTNDFASIVPIPMRRARGPKYASRPVGGVPRYLSEAVRRGRDISDSAVRAEALLSLVHEAWDDDLADAEDEDFDEGYEDE